MSISKIQDPTQSEAWEKLGALKEEHHSVLSSHTFRYSEKLESCKRTQLIFDACGYRFDFSRHLVNDEIVDALFALADQMEVPDLQKAMFAGEHINLSEDRAVLHTALRGLVDSTDSEANACVKTAVDERERMYEFVRSVHAGDITSVTNKRFKHVINIGIGGSDLGPAMAYEALEPYAQYGIDCHYVSNIDPYDLHRVLQKVDLEETLVVIVSKTFTTLETMTNAQLLLSYMHNYYVEAGVLEEGEDALKELISQQVIAVSSKKDRAVDFGINSDRIFEMWDWVGGRYSVDSSVGITLALAFGCERFEQFIEGLRAMDEYFKATPPRQSAIYMMALLNVWYTNFVGCETHAVLPYAQTLEKFPAFLQQLTMESNGKSTLRDGSSRLNYNTGEIYWGSCGTNAQHAYFQLLHQGTQLVPADFIAYKYSSVPESGDPRIDELVSQSHKLLLANFLAQTSALERGRSTEGLVDAGVDPAFLAAREFDGGRPSTTILGEKLTPFALGALIAFYEHVVFVQGALWGINSFDQWGVELGKAMANELAPTLYQKSYVEDVQDPKTKDLLSYYWSL